ncbi:tetratricopeptide repeat protein [Ketogulonicigenium robustum]|nr:tetratricopeptide repeat protein [Ketogulonicigenium robustum]
MAAAPAAYAQDASTGAVTEDAESMESLLARLSTAEDPEAATIASDIRARWADSGSATLDLLMRRAQAALDAGENDLAVWHLSTVIDYDPDFMLAYTRRAQAFLRSGQAGQAAADLGYVLQHMPENFDALRLLGLTFDIIGDTEAARVALRRALDVYPAMTNAREALERLEPTLDGTAI